MKYKHGKNFKLIDKKSIFIDKGVEIGSNVIIYENNRIEGKTKIGDNVIIYPGCFIVDSIISSNCNIRSSDIEKSTIGSNCSVGPFARLRPNSAIGNEVKIGNFVEIKNATIGNGTKVSHLAYVGDAKVGENCNIGCGVIFANYNGKTKNIINVGNNCFVGSNSNLIAPLTISDNNYICAGTTLTEDTNCDDFIIGRVRPITKEKRAHEYLKIKEN